MTKWNMIFDVDRCTNCRNCFISVLDEYAENEHKGYSAPTPRKGTHLFQIKTYEQGSGQDLSVAYVPKSCNNCANAPCVKASSDGAVYQREDGIVMIDPVKSKGRKDIVETCPYGQIHWNAEEEVPQVWTFDAHLLDNGWKQPRMVESCPTIAIEAVKCSDAEMEDRAKTENLRTLKPEMGTKPRIYYKNLDQVFENFLVGAVLVKNGEQTDSLEGAKVTLSEAGNELKSTQTDFFGDFKFTGLKQEPTEYTILVEAEGHGKQSRTLTVSDSHRTEPFVYAGG